MDVLFVCTANQCRSPMAGALFDRAARRSGLELSVGSAGLLPGGVAPPEEVLEAMAAVGIDLREHRSRQLDGALLASSSLVVTMTRQHLVSIVGEHPAAWPRSFRLAEVLQQAAAVGGRAEAEDLPGWVARLHAGRRAADAFRLDPTGDVADPMGQRRRAFERTRDHLERQVALLASALRGPLRPVRPV